MIIRENRLFQTNACQELYNVLYSVFILACLLMKRLLLLNLVHLLNLVYFLIGCRFIISLVDKIVHIYL